MINSHDHFIRRPGQLELGIHIELLSHDLDDFLGALFPQNGLPVLTQFPGHLDNIELGVVPNYFIQIKHEIPNEGRPSADGLDVLLGDCLRNVHFIRQVVDAMGVGVEEGLDGVFGLVGALLEVVAEKGICLTGALALELERVDQRGVEGRKHLLLENGLEEAEGLVGYKPEVLLEPLADRRLRQLVEVLPRQPEFSGLFKLLFCYHHFQDLLLQCSHRLQIVVRDFLADEQLDQNVVQVFEVKQFLAKLRLVPFYSRLRQVPEIFQICPGNIVREDHSAAVAPFFERLDLEAEVVAFEDIGENREKPRVLGEELRFTFSANYL